MGYYQNAKCTLVMIRPAMREKLTNIPLLAALTLIVLVGIALPDQIALGVPPTFATKGLWAAGESG